ncbi:MAG: ferrous iron transport protein B [Anaerolineae bacterium]|nr:ferrous iron transport protein B [Anaerolineae bacterium]
MHCHQAALECVPGGRPVVLIGNPNVGKSAVFSAFTGRRVDVSNYPGTTVEVTRGRLQLDGHELDLIDTPGIQSLLPRSEDERVARAVLLQETPWAVLQVADTKNLRRALQLTFQLAEHEVPFVLALNMADEAEEAGINVDASRLAQILGSDVVPTTAIRGDGLPELQQRLLQPRPVSYRLRYDGAIEKAVEEIVALLPGDWQGRRALALALLSGDGEAFGEREVGSDARAQIDTIVATTAAGYEQALGYIIAQQRVKCADCILADVYRAPAERHTNLKERLGHLMVHPVWGWPFLIAVLLALYYVVGVFGAGTMVDWMESVLFGELINPAVSGLVAYLPWPLLQDFLAGEYGLVTMALSYGIAIVLPIVFTFFLAFSILEDSGYLPRLAVMSNRAFQTMGLNGKAVLPMILGLGCDTMATLTTRILETRKERVQVTLLLVLGVPCSAQLGVLMGMAAILTGSAIALWLAVVFGTMFATGWLAARLLPGQKSDFILELPPVRRPQLGNILVKTVARLEWYLKEVLPLFILGTTILFVLDKTGLLLSLERGMAPLVTGLLGLPAETAGVFLIGFLRRDFGAAGLFNMARAGLLTTNQVVISLVVITLFIPCIANLLMVVREHGRRTAAWVTATVFPLAFGIGALLNLALRVLGINF